VPLPSLTLTFRSLVLLLAAVTSVVLSARTQLALPDLVLPVVVAGALWVGPSRGAILGLVGGCLVDLMPPGSAVLGTAALLYAAAGLVAGAGRREGQTPFGWIATVGAAAAVVATTGRLAVAALTGAPVQWPVVGVELLLTVVLCAVLVPVLVRCEQRLARGRG